jgi:hypothetical protein
MEDIQSIYLRHLQGRLGSLACELTRVRYSCSQATESWHPSINAYRCRDCIVIAAELAGGKARASHRAATKRAT